ncbi:MAG: ATP-binding cassette domain-containing protein [Anaerolineae bacterium]
MAAVLEAAGITKDFPGTRALDDVHLELQAGEIHAVIGENGAGKSTLMKILAGIESADSGEIRFQGRPVRYTHRAKPTSSASPSYIRNSSLVPPLTVAEHLPRSPPHQPWLGALWRAFRARGTPAASTGCRG